MMRLVARGGAAVAADGRSSRISSVTASPEGLRSVKRRATGSNQKRRVACAAAATRPYWVVEALTSSLRPAIHSAIGASSMAATSQPRPTP